MTNYARLWDPWGVWTLPKSLDTFQRRTASATVLRCARGKPVACNLRRSRAEGLQEGEAHSGATLKCMSWVGMTLRQSRETNCSRPELGLTAEASRRELDLWIQCSPVLYTVSKCPHCEKSTPMTLGTLQSLSG